MVYLPKNRDITYFGTTNYRENEKIFGIKRKDRRQHFYVVGKSGTGKSALLSNMLYQDIQNGYGCCVIDPHGELVEEIISAVPEDRLDDVVYFNPADADNHIGFNILELNNPRQKNLVTSGIMGIFTKIWANTWSARMEYILNNCILALLDTPGSTLLGISRILSDASYRKYVISNIKDPVVKNFWTQEFESWQERYRTEAIAPIQNKVGQFLSTDMIRNIVGQETSTINIPDIMNNQKIFLVNLSKGRIGEDNSSLLGGMLITKLQLAAMERVDIPEPDRKDFYLYVDEFQNFVTDSFANILSEARKYRLNLTIAHQYIAQLGTFMNPIVRDAVFGNVGSMVVFRVGSQDAEFLEKEFAPDFLAPDFVALPNYHIYLKLMIDGLTTEPFSARTLPPFIKFERDLEKEDIIVKNARILYQRPREKVEAEINDWSFKNFDIKEESGNKQNQVSFSRENNEKSLNKNNQPIPSLSLEDQEKRLHNQNINKEKLASLGIEFKNEKPTIKETNSSKNTSYQEEFNASHSKDLNHLDSLTDDIFKNLIDGISHQKDRKAQNIVKNPIISPKPNFKKEFDNNKNQSKETNSDIQINTPPLNHTFSKPKPIIDNIRTVEQTPSNTPTLKFTKNASVESKSNLKNLLNQINKNKLVTDITPANSSKVVISNTAKEVKPNNEAPLINNQTTISTPEDNPPVRTAPTNQPDSKIEADIFLKPNPNINDNNPKKPNAVSIPDDLLDQLLS